MRRLWPTSLVGQLALVVAIALFVAQAINFTLLLQGGRSLRQAQITAPAIARLLDAADRDAGGRGGAGRMRAIDVATTDPAATGGEHHPEVEAAIRRAFADAGRSVGGVSAVERKVTPASLPRPLDRREMRILRTGHELVVSAEVRPGRWLSLRSPWPRGERGLMWRLAGQTAIIYILVLGVVMTSIGLAFDSAWALGAGTARAWFARSPRRLSVLGGAGGVAMIGLGAGLATTSRAA